LCFGLFQGDNLRLGQDKTLLCDLGFQRFQSFVHRLEIMALPDASHAGRRDREATLPHLVGDTDLAERRLIEREGDNLRLNLRRDPVRHHRLLARDFLQRQLATFVVESLNR
jgi:hypothetical protein